TASRCRLPTRSAGDVTASASTGLDSNDSASTSRTPPPIPATVVSPPASTPSVQTQQSTASPPPSGVAGRPPSIESIIFKLVIKVAVDRRAPPLPADRRARHVHGRGAAGPPVAAGADGGDPPARGRVR